MSFVTLNLTTQALIRALQWRQIEHADKAETVARDTKAQSDGATQ